MRIYKERRLYFASSCETCGKRFQSFKRAKIKHGLCRKCRSHKVDPQQGNLFGMIPFARVINSGLIPKAPGNAWGSTAELKK